MVGNESRRSMSDTLNSSNFATQQNPVGGSGDDTVTASSNVLAFGSSGAMTFLNDGAGSRGVSGALGSVTVFGGDAGNNQLIAGQPPGEPIAAGTGDQPIAAGGNETLSGFGTTSSQAYFGGTGSDRVIMGAGAERYVGGQGNDVVVAGQGNDTMFAGIGPDVFTFNNTSGDPSDVIAGFKVGADAIHLQGFAAGADAQVFQTASVSGGNTVLHLPDGTVATMVGITQLTTSSIA
jgi:serralysin